MSKNQKSQQKAQQKADELFAEALVCSKMATKNKRANFEGIKSKFWRTVAKLEKIHRENHDPRYDKAHKDFEKAYKGWEKLHSAFKHYKGHFL